MQAHRTLALLTILTVSDVDATPIHFTDESTFLAAASGAILESFESVDTSVRNSNPIVTPNFEMTISPISSGAFNWRVTDDTRPSAGTVPTHGSRFVEAGAGLSSGGAAFAITFDFVTPIAFFGISILDFGDVGTAGELGINDGKGNFVSIASNPPSRPNANELFAGLGSSAHPITSVTLTKSTMTDGIALDEVYFVPVAIPEPSTLALLVGGGILGRRKNKGASDR